MQLTMFELVQTNKLRRGWVELVQTNFRVVINPNMLSY